MSRIRVLCDVDATVPSFLFLTAQDTLVGDLKKLVTQYIYRRFPDTAPGFVVTTIHDCFTPDLVFELDDAVRFSLSPPVFIPHGAYVCRFARLLFVCCPHAWEILNRSLVFLNFDVPPPLLSIVSKIYIGMVTCTYD